MPSTTGRLALLEPVGADAVSELRLAIAGNATTLDGAILFSTGTFSARPSSPTVAPQVYKATDTGLTYWWNGTAWQILSFAPNLRVISSNGSTLNPGDLAVVSPSVTVTLASAGADTRPITIVADKTTIGSTPVTVVSSSSQPIYGPGMTAGPTSFVLGTGLASASLVSLSGEWAFVAGSQQDTGWVPIAFSVPMTTTSDYYAPALRLIGDRVYLRGSMTRGAGPATTNVATISAPFIPASNAPVPAQPPSTAAYPTVIITSTGTMFTGTAQATGEAYGLDGASYSVS